jgi:hypothetical protein
LTSGILYDIIYIKTRREKEMKETIYDYITDSIVPIKEASNEALKKYINETLDDGYIEHNKIMACMVELKKRG